LTIGSRAVREAVILVLPSVVARRRAAVEAIRIPGATKKDRLMLKKLTALVALLGLFWSGRADYEKGRRELMAKFVRMEVT
jgi:hypothetical protein